MVTLGKMKQIGRKKKKYSIGVINREYCDINKHYTVKYKFKTTI